MSILGFWQNYYEVRSTDENLTGNFFLMQLRIIFSKSSRRDINSFRNNICMYNQYKSFAITAYCLVRASLTYRCFVSNELSNSSPRYWSKSQRLEVSIISKRPKRRILYLSCGIPFQVWTPDDIPGFTSAVVWQSRWEVIQKY